MINFHFERTIQATVLGRPWEVGLGIEARKSKGGCAMV